MTEAVRPSCAGANVRGEVFGERRFQSRHELQHDEGEDRLTQGVCGEDCMLVERLGARKRRSPVRRPPHAHADTLRTPRSRPALCPLVHLSDLAAHREFAAHADGGLFDGFDAGVLVLQDEPALVMPSMITSMCPGVGRGAESRSRMRSRRPSAPSSSAWNWPSTPLQAPTTGSASRRNACGDTRSPNQGQVRS
jgi:hypothetical protein